MRQFRRFFLVTSLLALGVQISQAGNNQMSTKFDTIKTMYDSFNARDIDGVVSSLTDDVQWANGMEGGYVQGHDGVRTYWTHQWSLVQPTVTPLNYSEAADGAVVVEVNQVIKDKNGQPDHVLGLTDKVVTHIFHFADDKVFRFDIGDSK
jgi:ketosteroid isomerase-like protein